MILAGEVGFGSILLAASRKCTLCCWRAGLITESWNHLVVVDLVDLYKCGFGVDCTTCTTSEL